MPDIFCDENHQYTVDGKYRVPSVTQVIKRVYDPLKNANLEALERNRKFGSNIHRVIHLYESGQPLVPEDPTKQYSNIVLKYLQQWIWLKKHKNITVFGSELPVYSKMYGYAGTLDIAATIGKRKGIIDVKTGADDPTMKLQTGGYKQAANETYPKDKIEDRYVVVLTGEGYPKLVPHTNYFDVSVFISSVQVYNFMIREGLK